MHHIHVVASIKHTLPEFKMLITNRDSSLKKPMLGQLQFCLPSMPCMLVRYCTVGSQGFISHLLIID